MRLIEVIFDTREKIDVDSIISQLKETYKIDVTCSAQSVEDVAELQIQQLPLADIIFLDKDTRNVLMLVERKGLSDFMSSLQPGHLQPLRLTEQLERMKGASTNFARIDGTSTLRLSLLLTGAFHTLDSNFRKALVTKTTRLALGTPSVMVTRIESLDDLPLFIARVVETLSETSQKEVDEAPTFHTLRLAVKKSRTDNAEKVYHTMLQLVHGMSLPTAKVITHTFPTIESLRVACRAQGPAAITKLKYRGRALNKKSAAIISSLFIDAL